MTPPPRRSRRLWIEILLGVGVFCGIGFALRWGRRADPPLPPPALRSGAGYYLYLSDLSVAPKDLSGDAWDSRGGAPDLVYEIHWRGVRVFRSPTKSDTLIARWNAAAVALDNAYDLSVDGVMRAARIVPGEGEAAFVEIVVLDSDTLLDDEIGRWRLALDALKEGANPAEKPAPLVERAIAVVVPFEKAGVETLTK